MMYTALHYVVVSESILAEWKLHRSRFSTRWLNQMFGRKQVVRVDEVRDENLEAAIEVLAAPHREHASKDVHIVSAALLTDRVVLSCDEHARTAFSQLTTLAALGSMLWANPERQGAQVVAWLGAGAPHEPGFLLIPR